MKIEDLIELSEKSNNQNYEYLLNAISDWPDEIESVEEYYLAVKKNLKIDNIDILSIEQSKIKIDVSENCWKLESIGELICFLKNAPHSNTIF